MRAEEQLRIRPEERWCIRFIPEALRTATAMV